MNRKLLLAAIALVAVALRWHKIDRLSLAHFDEGVLVSGAFGVWLHGWWHFPLSQPLQAPPLFPWLVAGAFGITQTPWPIMGIYVSATLGVATVIIYFAVLRRLFGERSALVGAALLAASDLHVAFSRMALTDVALTFFFVLGAYFVARLADVPRTASPRSELSRQAAWSAAFGAAAGAAWNTKYNGWMLLAVAATTWFIVALRAWLMRRLANGAHYQESFARPTVSLAILVATLIAIACFAPWYHHVDTTFPGGYAAVTRNHLRYFGGLADWPGRAERLWLSLTAFRHFGWLVTLAGTMLFVAWFALPLPVLAGKIADKRRTSGWAVLVGLCGLAGICINGSDAIFVLLSAAAIGPALIWGRWPAVFFAVWSGAFLVMTPFYHPYTRLLVPAMPAAIGLSIWLIEAAFLADRHDEPTNRLRAQSAGGCIAAACFAALALGIISHPFGLVPEKGIWRNWSTCHAYRELGDAVLAADLPSDAMVLCQGLPAMDLYIEREWTPLEAVPFDRWLPRVAPHRPCYLAVDFWGAHGENHGLALASLKSHLDCFAPIAVVPDDLNVATLLDYLPPDAVARRLAQGLPVPDAVDSTGRRIEFPARLDEPFANVIVLYRIDRECLKTLDNAASDALK